eukprot:1158988-Pelagomonas_calceolata.AAC.19
MDGFFHSLQQHHADANHGSAFGFCCLQNPDIGPMHPLFLDQGWECLHCPHGVSVILFPDRCNSIACGEGNAPWAHTKPDTHTHTAGQCTDLHAHSRGRPHRSTWHNRSNPGT